MAEQLATDDLQLIDVEKVFAAKDEKLLKRIPGFFIRYLKRIVHQEDINEFLIDNQGVKGIELVNRGVEYMNVKLNLRGLENIPSDPRIIVVANHPLGGLDGLCLIKTIADKLDPGVMVTSNDLLLNVKPLRSIFLGVNKHGGNSRTHIKEMQETFDGDHSVIFFPAGLVSRRRCGKIEDVDWKRTFVKKAVVHKRDILPVHISGRVSNFFYILANIRKLLGIRYNIEMLYLPNELFKHKDKELTITFGPVISWQHFTKDKRAEEWARLVKKQVYEIDKKK
ncbi:MAG: 1-acyl-sn-glycerol-3-phosphate acyltransferase [Bacteroidales bacterium]|nr:1-acyl-sn-glycerol-3-phosphate acyltransferase [Bacteroidales bacterium]